MALGRSCTRECRCRLRGEGAGAIRFQRRPAGVPDADGRPDGPDDPSQFVGHRERCWTGCWHRRGAAVRFARDSSATGAGERGAAARKQMFLPANRRRTKKETAQSEKTQTPPGKARTNGNAGRARGERNSAPRKAPNQPERRTEAGSTRRTPRTAARDDPAATAVTTAAAARYAGTPGS